MSDLTMYHNPRCSKSRQTLEILRNKGFEPTVIEYLNNPPDASQLRHIIDLLGVRAIDIVRQKEQDFEASGLAHGKHDDATVIAAICQYPRLLERPIVIHEHHAVIARPPEKVLKIL